MLSRSSAWFLLAALWLLMPPARAATVDATFTSASDVPILASSYSASGNDVKLTLGFSPARGTSLKVVSNTGRGFIIGRFSNLAQGQIVNLAHAGATYRFVANYFGGSGNDLVLEWGFQSACSWGLNNAGQLGDSSVIQRTVPVSVTSTGVLAGKIVVSVAAGSNHSLALCSDGTIAAWGSNNHGQLGVGTTTVGEATPLAVVKTGVLANKTVVAVAAGANHSMALCSDGTVATWGINDSGQLGDGAVATYRNVPVMVDRSGTLSGKTVVAVAAGVGHSIALCSDNTLVTWGNNSYGQLGYGTNPSTNTPVKATQTGVLSGRSVVSVAAGDYHSLALCSDGAVVTWGLNTDGQLGTGTYSAGSYVPVFFSPNEIGAKFPVSLDGGTAHSLALCSDGTIGAWGNDSYGQIGNGNNLGSSSPVIVTTTGALLGKLPSRIAAGYTHNLALCTDGTVVSWGRNQTGQLGNNSISNATAPVSITTSGVLSSRTAVALAAGTGHSLAVAASAVSIPSTESSLTSIVTSSGTLSPAFTSAHTSYTATVLATVSSITVTPSAAHAAATIRVNGSVVANNSASSPIPLSYGSNTIGVVANASSGGGSTSYTINVNRPLPSTVCSLAGLSVNTAALIPSFSSSALTYFARVPNSQTSVSVTPVVTEPNSTLTVNGVPQASGAASQPVALAVGSNSIAVRVLAQDGTTAKTYSINIVRERSPESLLSALAVSPGILSPAFRSGVRVYAFSVPAATPAIMVTPTSAEVLGAITVNGVPVASGTASQSIPLAPGSNTLHVVVTAPDTTSTIYTLHVVRPVSLDVSFDTPTSVGAVLPAFDATGLSAAFTLRHAPATGGNLTVIDHTGGGFIQGRFSNLAQGQKVNLVYDGVIYRFVANYHGGTGNDLVLQWAGTAIAAWGYNSNGALGNNSTADSNIPVEVDASSALAGKTVTAIASGAYHSVALCSDGSMASWGAGSYGQLGSAGTSNRLIPGQVVASSALTGKTVVAIASDNHNLALCSDGTMAAWGYNYDGQLGSGDSSNKNIPVRVMPYGALAGKSVTAVAVGSSHSLALCSDGSLVAWGANGSGQLGNGGNSSNLDPVAVDRTGILADKSVIAVSAGGNGSLVLCSDGSLAAWGSSPGNGAAATNVPVTPEMSGVLAGKSVRSIRRGQNHSMVLCTDGTLAAWGENGSGQLGNGGTSSSPVPVQVGLTGALAGRTVSQIAAGTGHSIALCTDGTAAAWGRGDLGAMGNGSSSSSAVPVSPDRTGVLAQRALMSLAASGYHTLSLAALPVPGPSSDFEIWLATRTEVQDPTPMGDPDGDGIPNVLEYVLNSDPGGPSRTSLPTVMMDSDEVRFTFTRRAGSVSETSQTFQYGSNMTDWTDLRLNHPVDPAVTIGTPDEDGNQTVTIAVPRTSDIRLFGRLKVSRP